MSVVGLYNANQLTSNNTKDSKKRFTKSFDLSQIAEDPMDSFLDTLGLWKKRIARDGSCLFRAVAEQIYPCQQYHEKVRLECVNYMSNNRDLYSSFLSSQITFDNYLEAMKNSLEYGGQLEIAAMSKLYKRDFIIYQHPNQPGIDVTQNNFTNKIYLCYSYNNHFDAIFTKAHRDRLALIQSLVYEILYDKVFGSGEQVTIARRLLRKSDTIYPKDYMKNDFDDEENIELDLVDSNNNSLIHESDININNHSIDNDNINDEEYSDQNEKEDETSQESEHEGSENNLDENDKTDVKLNKNLKKEKTNSFNEKNSNLIHKMPLPYKVAKSLDPVIYRNTAFDAWLASKKEHEEAVNQKAISVLQQGDKCLVRINNNYNEKWTLAFFQSMMHDTANVYIPELNENHCVLLENIKPYNNLNDLSNLHLQNYHASYGSNVTIQNVQKFVQAVNSQFSKIYMNNENKRRNFKKKQFSLKKSSSFHAFSTDLPTLVEVEEQNDEFFFYTNQLYGAHNSYLSIPHHSHHPNLYQNHHTQNNIHVNSNSINHHLNSSHHQQHHHHHHQNLNNSFFSLPHTQSHSNFNNNESKSSIFNQNKTKMTSSSSTSAISSSLQNTSINSNNLSNNSVTTNNNTNNPSNKSRRQRFNQNIGSSASNLNNNSYNNLNLAPLSLTQNNNNNNNNNNSSNNINNSNNVNNNNTSNGNNNNNKMWLNSFHNQPNPNMNIGPNASFFGNNHHSLPPLGANPNHLPSGPFNPNPINLASLVPPPNSAGYLHPPPPPTSHLHPHPNQVTSTILPPPPFIHPSPISHGLNQPPPPPVLSHGPPQPLPHQQPRPNFYNPVSSPFMFGPLLPSQIGAPPTLPPPQHGPGHFNHNEQQSAFYFSSGTNSVNNSVNSNLNSSSSITIQKNSSSSFSEHRKNENADNFMNKDINNASVKTNNIYQQVPHHLSSTTLKNSSANGTSSNSEMSSIQPPANTSNYLLMPAPPNNTAPSQHHSYNSLTRSHSFHSGITNSPYDTSQNTSSSNAYVDAYMQQGNPNNFSQNTSTISTNNNSSNNQPITHNGNNNSNNNTTLPQLNNITNSLSSNSLNTQLYSNSSNSTIGFENLNLNYNSSFPNYEVQYSRFDNNLSNVNGLIDDNLLNSNDTRNANSNWNKNSKSNKNNNLLSDFMYSNDPNQSNLSNTSNQQICYSNCFVVNIDGPINFNSTHSLLDDGSDLPLNDTNTMRFFYNLGIEYYRLNLATPYNQGPSYYAQNQINSSTTNSTSLPNTSLNQNSISNSNVTNVGSESTTTLSSLNNSSNTNNNNNTNNNTINNNNNNNNGNSIPNDQQLVEKPSQSLNLTNQQVVPNSLTTNINKIQSNQFYNSRRGH